MNFSFFPFFQLDPAQHLTGNDHDEGTDNARGAAVDDGADDAAADHDDEGLEVPPSPPPPATSSSSPPLSMPGAAPEERESRSRASAKRKVAAKPPTPSASRRPSSRRVPTPPAASSQPPSSASSPAPAPRPRSSPGGKIGRPYGTGVSHYGSEAYRNNTLTFHQFKGHIFNPVDYSDEANPVVDENVITVARIVSEDMTERFSMGIYIPRDAPWTTVVS